MFLFDYTARHNDQRTCKHVTSLDNKLALSIEVPKKRIKSIY